MKSQEKIESNEEKMTEDYWAVNQTDQTKKDCVDNDWLNVMKENMTNWWK